MKKLIIYLGVFMLALGLAFTVGAQGTDDATKPKLKVELSTKQKQELEVLHKGLLEKKIELIDKHVEFGMIPKEKGDKIKAKMEKRFEMMKENGFAPKCHDKDHDDE